MSLKSNKVIIELYGKPGVGKSTLARKIAKDYGFSHITSNHVTRKEYVVLFAKHPYVVLSWLLLIVKNYLRTKSIRQFRYNISLLFVSLKKINLARNSKEEQLIIDEGLVQRFLSYSNIILTEREISRLLKISPLGAVLVLVNDREVTKDRYDEAHDRGSEEVELLQQWRDNMAENLLEVTKTLKKTTPKKHLETKEISVDDIVEVTKTLILTKS